MAKKTPTTPVVAAQGDKLVKSALVQTYKAQHPDASPKDIVAALAKDGVEISAAHVSSVLSNARRNVGGAKSNSVESYKANMGLAKDFIKANGDVKKALAAIQSVGSFIDSCGGSEKARAALSGYVELIDMLK